MHSKSKPIVSIVVPVFNAAATVQMTIESIKRQTLQEWECLLVIDQNSNDESLSICQAISSSDSRFQVVQNQAEAGVAANRNLGIQLAKGEYICFLDADDRWRSEKLERQLQVIKGGFELVCHAFQPVGTALQLKGSPRVPRTTIGYKELLINNDVGCSTVMVQASVIKNKKFEKIKHEDLQLWLELTKGGKKFIGMPEVLSEYTLSSSSLSGNKFKALQWRWNIYRHQGMSYFLSAYYFCHYLFWSLIKRI